MLVIHYWLEKSESTKKLSLLHLQILRRDALQTGLQRVQQRKRLCTSFIRQVLRILLRLATAYVKRRKKGFCHKCPHTVLGLQNTFEITFSASGRDTSPLINLSWLWTPFKYASHNSTHKVTKNKPICTNRIQARSIRQGLDWTKLTSVYLSLSPDSTSFWCTEEDS